MFSKLKDLDFQGVGLAGPVEIKNTGLTPINGENLELLKSSTDYIEYYNSSVFTTSDCLDIPWLKDFKLVGHSGFLNIAASEAPNLQIINLTKEICEIAPPLWLGEDVGTNYLHGQIFPDIIPPARVSEGVKVISERVKYIQKYTNVPFVIENTYCYNPVGELNEWDFLNRIAEKANCGLLMDIGHFLISTYAIGLDPKVEITKIDLTRIIELHVASVRKDKYKPNWLYDDHSVLMTEEINYFLNYLIRHSPNLKAVTVELPDGSIETNLKQVELIRTSLKI
jgi:uncharacterized protein (UPF0276 family)